MHSFLVLSYFLCLSSFMNWAMVSKCVIQCFIHSVDAEHRMIARQTRWAHVAVHSSSRCRPESRHKVSTKGVCGLPREQWPWVGAHSTSLLIRYLGYSIFWKKYNLSFFFFFVAESENICPTVYWWIYNSSTSHSELRGLGFVGVVISILKKLPKINSKALFPKHYSSQDTCPILLSHSYGMLFLVYLFIISYP